MNGLILFLLISLTLGAAAFLTKRRFGVLALALVAGSKLSSLWSVQLVGILNSLQLNFSSIWLAGVASAGLVVLPAVLLLFSGPTYRSKLNRLLGAVMFGLFAAILVCEPLSSALSLDGMGKSLFDFVASNQIYIVTAGIVLALIDTLGIHIISHKR